MTSGCCAGAATSPPRCSDPVALLDAVAGASYVGRGLGTWRRRPGLMLLGAVPALLVALVVLGALVALLVNLGDLVAWATPFADAWAVAALRQ